MSNINNKIITNKILLTLEILAISVFSIIVFLPTETKAYIESSLYPPYIISKKTNYNPSPTISSIEPNSIDEIRNKTTIIITGSGFTPNSVIRKNNSDRVTIFIDSNHLMVDIYPSDVYNQDKFFLTVFNGEPGGGYSNASIFTIKNNTVISTTNKTINNNTTDIINTNTIETNNTVSTNNIDENYGSLTANALLGSNSFMPNGIVQWIFFVILIVAIIFLWRYVHRSEEVYMSEPMKHA
ncbi:MAG: Cell surface receptor IPT/TIG domain protein [Candidatus Nomurabacteria bacterium GW2011_GWE1_32_28]|uniref:Cell surface receptor IPT/TIG domain protein n=1 Tax=Candidatus Nomurabacteria bacterium GW2011_GWF1_31_48 TaxID=1618767 RepID=A0A0G0BHY8_9BACT|nr:MAG: Cell surface receptor IPT/TIG domain protein [Candidatus Nomurabacteria bacterium GW2011_GWF2_30_133]KKP28899.1 MAG: Cell surface receptor IPT/TIG domain protein [Candidatus Nomurabacteria bacterium GW2011_GWE2_31_40]KKP30637.1 MAG: Cell surface receptor IPT/TIG domain protein [Candidatus Nomurabacteria bacterium GW2011_GWF1_31_48]KKP35155.1 MAG: Cell surface receptor IPT/TIG domain protein [Candidatus Nomurabacteria bacterium GW2011_GWE1_32_28]HAS80465.1 hypothetical protein [Candidatu